MKTQLKYFLSALVLISIISSGVKAAGKTKSATVVIQTSAVCEMCQARIEKALKNTTGITTASLNLKDKKVKVKYDPAQISPEQIRAVISNTGYDADKVKKSPTAFNNLPHCCQKPENMMP